MKTFQTKFSEGFSGKHYYLDYKCDKCGTINPFLTKQVLQEKPQFCFKG
jgi:phage FluMu protein Com